MGILVLQKLYDPHPGTTLQAEQGYMSTVLGAESADRAVALATALGLALLLMLLWEVARLTFIVLRDLVHGFAVTALSVLASLAILAFVVLWALAPV
jgi:hypothetical protein